MVELKPCPFCGGKDIGLNKRFEEHYILIGGEFKLRTLSDRYQIKCDNCPCGTYFAFYLGDAIEAWNRRAEDANQAKT